MKITQQCFSCLLDYSLNLQNIEWGELSVESGKLLYLQITHSSEGIRWKKSFAFYYYVLYENLNWKPVSEHLFSARICVWRSIP